MKAGVLIKAYADSSFIVALYLQQQSSTLATAFMQRHGEPLPFTPWHRLETRNAIRLSVFHKLVDLPQSKAQLKQMDEDLHDETLLVHTPVDWVAVLREAEKLGAAHAGDFGCRSGDLFHVAAAAELGFDFFLTFDDRQKKFAKAVGLSVKF
jgi:predicted nucleic acid-binding protein